MTKSTPRLLSEFFGYTETILAPKFLTEISNFSRKIVSISGGIDSTATALALWREGIECELFWNNTGRTMPQPRTTVANLIKLTGWEFHIAYPFYDKRKLREQVQKTVDDVVAGRKKYNKHEIACCYYLKEKPLRIWIRTQNFDPNMVIISSICGYEGMQRQIRLGEIRNRNTYLRFKKMEKCWFAYPLRDMTNPKHGDMLKAYVQQVFPQATHSGCIVCPVVAIMEDSLIKRMEADEQRIKRSKHIFLKNQSEKGD